MQNVNDSTDNGVTGGNVNRTIFSGYLMALSEEATDMQLVGIRENQNRQIYESIRYELVYLRAPYNLTMAFILYSILHVYWYCLLSISFDIGFEYGWHLIVLELMLADINAFPRPIFDNELLLTTDRFGSARGERPINAAAFVGFTVTFSPTVQEDWPSPRESVPVEDAQPHDMPRTHTDPTYC